MRTFLMVAILVISGCQPARAPHTVAQVQFGATDGLTLVGTLYEPARTSPGVLLLHHCNTGDRAAYDGLANGLARRGFHVLTVDFRGHGESRSERVDVTIHPDTFYERHSPLLVEDAAEALKMLASSPRVDVSSMGIVAAGCAVRRAIELSRRYPQVRAIVAISGRAADDQLEFVESASAPAFMTTAAQDDGDGMAAIWAREIAAISQHEHTLHRTYETGGHGAELLENQDDLAPAIVKWMHDRLFGDVATP
jgi:dienelactone hydrolase